MKKFSAFSILIFWAILSCKGQNNKLTMNDTKSSNPMLCDVETGLCELPGSSKINTEKHLADSPKPVHIVYFTDPICSSCWGIEPQLRRLKLEYGNQIDLEYRMGGLLPSWEVYNSGSISKPSDVAHHWDEVSVYYEMPIDGDVWLEDPLPSSYPPSIAFKAAQIQDEKKAIEFLRRIREMVFLEKKNITKWQYLELAAKQVGLDAAKFKADFEGKAKDLFQEDLNLAHSLGVRSFPTLIFSDADQQKLVIKGARPYEQFEQTLKALYPQALKSVYDVSPMALFKLYPTLTTKEFSVLATLSKAQAEKTLTTLFEQKKLEQFSTKNGVLWRKIN